jgi:hypothetical protein
MRKSKRFRRAGYGLFRMRKIGAIYAVFKSAGRTHWKSLGTDDVNQAQELLGQEIKHVAKVAGSGREPSVSTN